MDRQTALRILNTVREKSAEIDPVQAAASQSVQMDALKDAGKTGLSMLGIGAASRGVMGLVNVIKRNLTDPKPTEHVAVLPLPVRADDPRKRSQLKLAGAVTDFMSGKGMHDPNSVPWHGGAVIGAGLLGGLGGWKVIDHILNKRREAEMDAEMHKARGQFNQAMLGEYSEPVNLNGKQKAASDDLLTKIANDLDALYDMLEKKSNAFTDLLPSRDTMGRVASTYGMYAVPAAMFGGVGGYALGAKNRRVNIIQKALKQREARRQKMQPAEIYAMPVPVSAREAPAQPNAASSGLDDA